MATAGRGAHNKGFSYERRIAKTLSKAFHTNVQRTGGSGAYRGIDTEYNQSEIHGENGFVGDLFFPKNHPMSVFNYELKNHDNVRFNQFFNSNGEIPSFVEQVTTDSNRLGGVGHSVPCLIVHIKREDDYVIIPFENHTYQKLAPLGQTMITVLSYQNERTTMNYHYQVIVTTLDKFTQLDPMTTAKYYKNLDWNKFNHHLPKPKDVNVNNLVKDIGS